MGRFRFYTAGESHGKGLIVLMEGIPAGLRVSNDGIDLQLARRQAGYGRGDRMKIEHDRVEIISGIRHGITIGSPISLLIWNKDWENWRQVMSHDPADVGKSIPVTVPRPGHADLAGILKYNHHDIRNVLERASARETAARVAAGAIARILLAEFGIQIESRVLDIGGISAKAEQQIIAAINRAKETGDTLGGTFEVIATGVPVGLGSYIQWDQRLDGRIAQAVMSIPGVKGVEIGLGFQVSRYPGSQVHDEIYFDGRFYRKTNHAGGLEGGVTNGEPVVVRAAMKPIPTLRNPLNSVDIASGVSSPAHSERSDVCAVQACSIVAEAMVALSLCEAFIDKFGGDSLEEMRRNFAGYLKGIEEYMTTPATGGDAGC